MEVPERIELCIGEIHTLKLPGLGTAGYVWTYELLENSDLVEVSATTTDTLSPTEANNPSVGSSVDEIFTLRALKEGRATIRFVQQRPWERTQVPLREHTLEITINS